MKAKLEEKEKTKELRRQGKSIVEIEKIVGCPRSSISKWCRNVLLSEKQVERLSKNAKDNLERGRLIVSENKKKERIQRQRKYQQQGIEKIQLITEKISERDLWLLGTSLYWAEGWKTGREICFTNSDPVMVELFMKFLVRCVGIAKNEVKLLLQIWSDLDREEVIRFWSELLNCSIEQFYIVVRKTKRTKTVKLKHGIMQLRYGANKFYYLEGLIKGFKGIVQGI